MKRMILEGIPAVLLLLAACKSNDLGSGANTVDREFSKPAPEVWKASVKSVQAMELKVSHDAHDQLGGELVAQRGGGQEVHLWVRSLDEKRSHVSVRVEPGDRALAILVQERIADSLGLGRARAGFLGGNSEEGVYLQDLGVAMLTARRTLRSLDVTLVEHEAHADWSQIDGRLKDSTPIRISMDRREDQKIKVTFIAGNEKSDDNRAFAHRMKEEYEAAMKGETETH